MASGFALGSPDGEDNYSGLHVETYFDVLLHPNKEKILLRSFLEEQIPSVHWTPQSSGTTIPPDEAAHLEYLWAAHLDTLGLSTIQFSEEIASPERYWEGATYQITVNRYERDARARRACIQHHGCKCVVCGFNFESVYGIGEGFIHVHHLTSLAEIDEEYEVNPVTDLIPVCPNCHAMLHWYTPAITCEELRAKREASAVHHPNISETNTE
jgi:5-methylcytosine-specific restriction protein A